MYSLTHSSSYVVVIEICVGHCLSVCCVCLSVSVSVLARWHSVCVSLSISDILSLLEFLVECLSVFHYLSESLSSAIPYKDRVQLATVYNALSAVPQQLSPGTKCAHSSV